MSGNAGKVDEYIHFERGGPLRGDALEWLMKRTNLTPLQVPKITQEVYDEYVNTLRTPKRIRVKTNGKWPEVVSYEFDETNTPASAAVAR